MARIVIFQILVLTRISEGAAKRKNCRVKVLFKLKLGRHLCAETPPKAVKNITYLPNDQNYCYYNYWSSVWGRECAYTMNQSFLVLSWSFISGTPTIFMSTAQLVGSEPHYQYNDTPNALGAFFVIYIVFIRPWSRKLTRLILPSNRSVELPHSRKRTSLDFSKPY